MRLWGEVERNKGNSHLLKKNVLYVALNMNDGDECQVTVWIPSGPGKEACNSFSFTCQY